MTLSKMITNKQEAFAAGQADAMMDKQGAYTTQVEKKEDSVSVHLVLPDESVLDSVSYSHEAFEDWEKAFNSN